MNTLITFFLSLAFTCFQVVSWSQTGTLELDINGMSYNEGYYYGSNVRGVVSVWSENGFKFKEEVGDLDFYYLDTNLMVGNYSIEVSVGDSILERLDNIQIIDSSITIVEIRLPYVWNYSPESNKFYTSVAFNLMTGDQFINNNANFRNYYKAQYQGGGLYQFAKNFGVGFLIGTGFSMVFSDKDHSMSPNIPHKSERYVYWDLNNSAYFRTILRPRNKHMNGFVLDLGGSYNFPLMFHYVLGDGKTKHVTRWIHQFTDFSVFTRIGYAPVTLFAEYTLTSYLMEPYFEPPRLRLGLSFNVQFD